nr:MAG TPA: hypothetical protein [Caudoviricetes sp.]
MRTTRPERNQQDKPPTRPAHPPRKELQPTKHPPANSNHHQTEGRPEPRTTAHQAAGRGELRRGLRGTAPHTTPPATPEPEPTSRTPPPTRHPQPRNLTAPRNPTPKPAPPPPSNHPTTHTPPGTLHTCHGPHPTDVNACQQTGTNSGNKSSRKRTTNAPASTQPPPHLPPAGRCREAPAGGTTPHAPCAQLTSTTSTPATTTN